MTDLGDKCDALSARIIALHHLLDEREERTKDRFASMEKAVSAAFASAEKAIDKADAANQKHFAQINEFRAALEDQTARYLEKEIYAVQHAALITRQETLTNRVVELEQRFVSLVSASAAQSRTTLWIIGIAIALVAPAVTIAIYLLGRH